MNIAIIPARGGSGRIPKKNIKDFLGKPMIAYSINAAKESGLFDRVIVSTDSQEIADVAKKAGAEIPFLRPAHLGENKVSIATVMQHAVTFLQEQGTTLQYACCVVATAPLLRVDYLKQGFELIKNNDVDTVVSVKKFSFPIYRGFKKDEKGRLRFIWPEHEFTNSQDLPESYHDAAQFYWINVEKFLKNKSLLGKEVLPVVIPEYLVRDIDTMEDWESAEIAYQICKQKGML